MIEPLEQTEFNTELLPPAWAHPCKQLVYSIACPLGTIHHGSLHYSRWIAVPLQARIAWPGRQELVFSCPDFYDSQPAGTQYERLWSPCAE